jgi:imidazolonepropionase
VGSTRRLENLNQARAAIQIPVPNCIVMPGFIDSSMQLTLLAQNPGKTGRRRRKLRDFYNDSLILLRSCLALGTLTAAIRASAGVHAAAADLSVLRQLTRIGNTPIGVRRIWHPEAETSGAWETVAKQKLADCVVLSTSTPLTPAVLQQQMDRSLEWRGGPVRELKESLARSSPRSVFCHHDLTAAGRKALANSGATAIFEAGSLLLDRLPAASVRGLLDQGGAIALGSGYDALCEPNFNMQLVLALAVRRLNLTIEEAIVATTINAAYAMNCGHRIGSLEPGKQADVLILNLTDYREIPRRLGVNHVAMAIRNGEIVINRNKWRVGAA